VTHPVHQVSQGRLGLGRPGVSRVPEIVEVETGHAGPLGPREKSGSEHALELIAANGAVIVYFDIDGRDGSGNVVVGLQ
jgi:hypothetical protein